MVELRLEPSWSDVHVLSLFFCLILTLLCFDETKVWAFSTANQIACRDRLEDMKASFIYFVLTLY